MYIRTTVDIAAEMKEYITVKVNGSGYELYEYGLKGWKIVSHEYIGNSYYIVKLEHDSSDKVNE